MEKADFYNPIWRKLVLDEIQVKLSFLAANILLSRLKTGLKFRNSTEDINKAHKEIFELYYNNKHFQSAQKDILLLLNKQEVYQ